MSEKKNEDDVGVWLSMDIPDDSESEDEYNLDDSHTDEQAQQQERRMALNCLYRVQFQ